MKHRKKGEGESSLRLTDKRHPAMGIVSAVMGVVSIILFAVLCYQSGRADGQAGMGIGAAGIGCLLLNIVGFCIAWITLRQENIRPLFPTIGAVLNGVLMLVYVFLYVWGTSI